MMAPRKKRSRITERDESFTRVLQVAREDAGETAFSARDEDISSTVPNPKNPPEPDTSANPAAPDPVPVDPPLTRPDPGSPASGERPNSPGPDRDPGNVLSVDRENPPGDTVTIRIAFRVRADLVARAEAWGRAARCPAQTILRTALRDLQPDLLGELRRLDHRDISHARQIDVAARLDTTLTISTDLHEALQARLD